VEAGWAPGPVWTGAENLAPTEIRSTDRPARSESLYRSFRNVCQIITTDYETHTNIIIIIIIIIIIN
jgi:hypothetical protein